MDRRSFFRACTGVVAGIVLLPLKALKGKELKLSKAIEGKAFSSLCNCFIVPRADQKQPMFHFTEDGKALIHLNGYAIVPIEKYNDYIDTQPLAKPLPDRDKAKAIADWAKEIRDGSVKEYLRQRHKVG